MCRPQPQIQTHAVFKRAGGFDGSRQHGAHCKAEGLDLACKNRRDLPRTCYQDRIGQVFGLVGRVSISRCVKICMASARVVPHICSCGRSVPQNAGRSG